MAEAIAQAEPSATPTPELVWQLDALLGEGPAWMPDEGALWFVDIKGGKLHRFHPQTGTRETIETGGQPSFVVGCEDGGLIVGSDSCIHRVEAGRLGAVLAPIPQPAHNRTNDATVDASGRLWVATMDDHEERETGSLWCLEAGTLRHAGTSAVVTNGPAVTADGCTLYRVNSGERRITRHAMSDSGELDAGELFVQLKPSEGHPDGIVLDSENCIWVGLWDGWGVRRYAPDGTLLLHVPLPSARVTKVAFGGPDLKTVYVTTARIGLDEEALARQPLAGGLFAFAAPAPGLPLPKVRL
ncbi:SMP-30/gluconolactonase/LRE family protein [Novosphingobium sp. 9U]|uniref:SMP-30/gluconolactonase/LRE family protein n=1 Tax=Novosphingobium sp. 9U TaxID=2653158 RepID=UPI0012EF92C8|nr:SMP-30/gluconolactonase/LRE family protein [Novosphingobium sp. 9U]VWX46732.1 Gluconolactonase [Novosphingobium sp. 9U]